MVQTAVVYFVRYVRGVVLFGDMILRAKCRIPAMILLLLYYSVVRNFCCSAEISLDMYIPYTSIYVRPHRLLLSVLALYCCTLVN